MTARTEEERMERLPAWAKLKIRSMQGTIDHLKTELAVGPEGSDTFRWNGGLDRSEDTPLGTGPVIRFGDALDVRWRNGELEVRGIQGGSLRITPWVSNVIHVGVDGR